MLKNGKWVGLFSLAVGWTFDALFWKKQPGISFAIFVLLCLAAGIILAWREDKRPAATSLVLILPVVFFASVSFFRAEPLTQTFSYLLTLGILGLLAITFLGGRWILYSITDYILGFSRLAGSLLGGVFWFWEKSASQKPTGSSDNAPARSGLKGALPIMRGLALALPVVAVFALLLASADPIFSQRLAQLISFLNIQNLPETLGRLGIILVLAYGLAGVYLFALLHSQEERLTGLDKPWLAPFIGFTESAIVLACVSLLFIAFVAIQFQYFFGGHANITVEGFTYAEYARRGFGELVAVAFFSLMLLLGLNSATRRQTPRQRGGFSSLVAVLVALVVIILVSAFQRLLLYEQAYGFTRLRTVIHIFMIWLGVLLVATLLLELANRVRIFPAAVLLVAIGFGVTLSLINVDGWIVRQNVQRARLGLALDSAYLTNLSTDAVPALVSLYNDPTLPEPTHLGLRAALACQSARIQDETQKLPWQSFNFSRSQASRSLQSLAESFSAYALRQDAVGRWFINIDGREQPCFSAQVD